MRWKKLPINENYLVSDTGLIKGYKGTLLSQGTDTKGYKFVNIYEKGKPFHLSMHRAVALTFIDNPNNYPQVNHLDEDKTNNHYTNLEWCTNKQNFDYSISKAVQMLDKNTGKVLMEFKAMRDANIYFGKNVHQSISKCCNGIYKSRLAYGYKWKFK